MLFKTAKRINGNDKTWLADDYDTLTDYAGAAACGTLAPINTKWRSPFNGKTLPNVIAFIGNAPKPPKPLDKRYCAVLIEDEFEDGRILICKSSRGDSDSEDAGEDEDPGFVASEEDDEPPVQEAQPGSIKTLLLQHSKVSYDGLPPRHRPTTKRAIKALGNDYQGIQIIPTAEYKVEWFHYTFAHYKWTEAYFECREQGKCI